MAACISLAALPDAKVSQPLPYLTSCRIKTTSSCNMHPIPLHPAPSPRVSASCFAVALNSDFYHIPYTEGVPVGTQLRVFNLPCNCDKNDLVEHFESCGSCVKSLEISSNPQEGNAFGFVTLGSLDQACTAVAQLDGTRFQGRCVRMDFVKRVRHVNIINSKKLSKKPRNSSIANRLYIGNLPWRVNDAMLMQLFSTYGTVQGAKVVRDRMNGRSRGFGFVVMSTSAEVEKAIAVLDGCEIEGRPLKVGVASSQKSST